MSSLAIRQLSIRLARDLLVRRGAGSATFGLPKPLQQNDPESHKLLQQSKISYLPKSWLRDLGYYPEVVYEIHLSVHPNLQGKGYAAKMVRALALEMGHPLWIMKSRIINPQVLSVVEKLKRDPLVTVSDIEYEGALQGWVVK